MKSKQAFTLIEVLLALSLTGILLSVLFTSYKENVLLSLKAKEKKTVFLAKELLHLRLSQVFKQIPSFSLAAGQKKSKSPLTTYSIKESKSLALNFAYHCDVDIDSAFCGMLEALLYLNDKSQICLMSWPQADGEPRNEVLLENTASLSFSFFDPREKMWKSEWKEAAELPSMLKLCAGPQTFVYFFPTEA